MKAGVIFLVTSGSYSDYGIRATFLALRDFSWDAEVQDFERQRQPSTTYLDFNNVLEVLIARGLVRHVYLPEIVMGEFGRLNPHGEAAATKGTTPLRGWSERCIDHDDCINIASLGIACAANTEAA